MIAELAGHAVELLNGVCHRAHEANNCAGRSATERDVRAGVADAFSHFLVLTSANVCSIVRGGNIRRGGRYQ